MKQKASTLSTAAVAACMLFAGCGGNMTIKTLPYPDTKRDTTVRDDYHGTQVADPYRWLEDDNSAETARWVAEENAITSDYLSQIPYRETLRQRLTDLWNYPKEGVPRKVGDYYFYFKNDGLQNQSVLYYQLGADGTPEVFLDPNTLSQDGTVALGGTAFSPDNRYMAYSVSMSGSDWAEVHVMEIATRRKLPDVVKWIKFSGASWGADSEGFFYSRYDEPKPGRELSAQNQYQQVYYHKLGEPQSADRLIYKDAAHPLRYFNGQQSKDGKWIFVTGTEGTSGSEVLYRKSDGNGFKVLLPGFANDYSVLDCRDDKAYVYTNAGAPNFRLAAIDLNDPSKGLQDVLPEQDNLLVGVNSLGGYLIAVYMEDATHKVYQYTYDGKPVREIALDMLGTVAGFTGNEDTKETFFSLSNFITPATVYSYVLATGETTLFRKPQVNYDPDLFAVDQVFFESKDGTRVPMFIVHRKDMELNGNNPTLMYGYGGFNISLTPTFSPANIALLEQGGIYVLVNLRGGGEYGEKWHRGGMLANKQNVFDDYIGAAEWLVANKYTNPGKLAINGGSNGGLLVGACEVQRPDLFAVCIAQVGVLDMLRYHLFTIGWGWAVEYGTSADPEQFAYLYKYSPLHNIKEGVCYPATLIATADHDDRVVPAHSFKFAAALQAAQGCDRPILLRVESKAGHSAGKPTSKRIDEAADILSFFFWNTGTRKMQ